MTEKAEWHEIDAKGQVLGRLATQAAQLLIGKHRVDFTPRNVAPVFVVVKNSDEVALTGRKEEQKVYHRYSGYPGGLRERTVAEQRQRDSRKIIENAVHGMLPKNGLRKQRMAHLRVYTGDDHPHKPQV